VHRERVQRFWQSPSIPEQPGLKAVDLFDAVHDGRVKAVWIMATNPVVSLPDADRVRAALAKCELVIVSDCIADTDTMRLAHIRLPALGWGEKDGTVTNSERRISRQRGLLPPPGEAKPDWWALAEVGKAMGYGEAFAYSHPAQIFREHAALSAFENNPEMVSATSIIGLLAQLDNREAYDALKPVQWPVTPDASRWAPSACLPITVSSLRTARRV
jgi:assimilatory nitrate reductase catalytic subunit